MIVPSMVTVPIIRGRGQGFCVMPEINRKKGVMERGVEASGQEARRAALEREFTTSAGAKAMWAEWMRMMAWRRSEWETGILPMRWAWTAAAAAPRKAAERRLPPQERARVAAEMRESPQPSGSMAKGARAGTCSALRREAKEWPISEAPG